MYLITSGFIDRSISYATVSRYQPGFRSFSSSGSPAQSLRAHAWRYPPLGMACFYPLGGWIAQRPNESGRHPVTFRMREGWQDRPIDLPCGKCLGCIHDKAHAWAVRCYHESTQHERNSFLTLTYDDSKVPAALVKDDLQRFFKRLRARGVKFRYFACGEYGGRTGRPHYHALFFGQDFRDGAQQLGIGTRYYTNSLVDEVWGNGFVTIAPVEPGSVFYTTGYAVKDVGRPDTFHLVSKRPYIGHGWLARYHDDIARNGFVTIEGKKAPIPRSYLLRPEFALEFDSLKEDRREFIEGLSPEDICARREALRNKERNLRRRIDFKRSA